MTKEDMFLMEVAGLGGGVLKLSPGKETSINIFDVAEQNGTAESMEDKMKYRENNLRELLKEANNHNMTGTRWAREKLDDGRFLQELDKIPQWRDTAIKVLTEYAEMPL